MSPRASQPRRSSAERIRELLSFDLAFVSGTMAPDTKGREPASSVGEAGSRGSQLSEAQLGQQLSLFSLSLEQTRGHVAKRFDEAVSPEKDRSSSGEASELPPRSEGGDSDAGNPKRGDYPATQGRSPSSYSAKPGEPSNDTWKILAGFDEAGRGALAGPVVVGCVSFDRLDDPAVRAFLEEELVGLNDSKQVSPKNRERLYERIIELGAWAVGAASAKEIDQLGIVPACRLAADRARRRLGRAFDLALCDRGLGLSDLPVGATQASFTKGDARSLHISAASVLAKVSRDRWMSDLTQRAPGYGFEQHKGYGTAAHRSALAQLGPTRFHRRTFLGGRSAENQSC